MNYEFYATPGATVHQIRPRAKCSACGRPFTPKARHHTVCLTCYRFHALAVARERYQQAVAGGRS